MATGMHLEKALKKTTQELTKTEKIEVQRIGPADPSYSGFFSAVRSGSPINEFQGVERLYVIDFVPGGLFDESQWC